MPETPRDGKSLRQEAERFLEQQLNSSDTALSKECIRFLQQKMAPEHSPALPTSKASTREEFQLSIASELGKIAYWEYDLEDDLFTFNDQFYAIFGTTAQEQGGYRMSPDRYANIFVHPDHSDLVREHIKIAFANEDPNYNGRAEHKIIYANGETGYISVQICLIKNKEGKTVKTYGANQDITEITQSRRHLERINRLLDSIRSINKLINTEKDADTLAFKTVNTLIRDRGFAAAKIAIFDRNSQSPRTIVSPDSNLSPAQNLPTLEDDDWLVSLQGLSPEAFNRSITHLHRFETTLGNENYRTLCIPMKYEERFFGLLCVTSKLHETNQSRRQELTQELADDLGYALFRLELEQQKEYATAELKKAKELAEQACLAKDQFLAVISHEIRTPLNPILGYTQLLQQRKQSDTDRTYLDSIRRAGKQQLTLIDHILT